MHKIKYILIFICISSCTTNTTIDFKSTYGMYSIMVNEFTIQSTQLEKEITSTIEILKNEEQLNLELIEYEEYTDAYLAYIDTMIKELQEDANIINLKNNQNVLANTKYVNNLFFDNEVYSLKGREYIKKTSEYKQNILELVEDKNLIERIRITLNTNNIFDKNKRPIKLLEYYFRDQSLIATIAYFKNKKRQLLEYEKEFINLSY